MSVNDTKEIAEKRGRSLPTSAQVSLRDRIPAKLKRQLEEVDASQKVRSIWNIGNTERQDWLEKQKTYLADWDEFFENHVEGPWEGASQLHLPITFTHAKAMHARLMQALFGVEPPFVTKPRSPDEVARVDVVDNLMAYLLRDWANNYDGVKDVASDWVWEGVTTGVGIMKARWHREYTSYLDVVEDVVITQDTALGEVRTTEEREELVKDLVFDGPVMELVFPEDIVIIGGGGNPNKADAVIHRQFMTADRLWQLADQRIFDEDAVKEVILSGDDSKGANDQSGLKDDRAQNTGMSSPDSSAELDEYEILEAYVKIDANQDGLNEDVVIWMHKDSGEILRATYLHRINKQGKRPFFKWDFHRRPGETYGRGLVEIMHPLSVELDALHNQAIDAGTIRNMPFGFYRAAGSLDPEKIQLSPGDLYPVDDPTQDVFFPRVNGGSEFHFQAQQVINDQINRATGLSDLNFGLLTAQGAARTATGARALIGESNANLDVHLQNLSRAWRDCLRYLFSLVQQRMPDGFSFRVTGNSGADFFAKDLSREEIRGKFDFEISENSANSNRAIQQNVAQQVLGQTLDPISIQTGIVSPGNIFEAKKNLLQSFGVKDWSRFISKPQGHQLFLTPEEEAGRVLNGLDVPVQLNDDHQSFIDYAAQLLDGEELNEYPADAIRRLQAQVLEHQRALQAIQQAQRNQAVQSQAQANSAVTGGEGPDSQVVQGAGGQAQGGDEGGGQETP